MSVNLTANSSLTAEQVEHVLLGPLRQRSTFLAAGFLPFSSNGEPIRIPALSAFGTASFVAEGDPIPEHAATTTDVVLLESTVHAVKSLLRISNETISQSFLDVQSEFAAQLVADAARKVDAALWAGGTATAGSPIGVANWTGVTSSGTVAGTALASGDLFTMEETAALQFTDASASLWAISPRNFTRIRNMADNTGARLLAPSLADGAPATLLGKAYIITTHLPDSGIWLLDRSQVAVGLDRSASVSWHPDRYAEYDETAVRITLRVDTKPLHAAACVKLSIT